MRFEINDGRYLALLAPENRLTDGDERLLVGPVTARGDRLPLHYSDQESDAHDEARLVGALHSFDRQERDGLTWFVAEIEWDDDELALEAKRLVDEDFIRGISVHLTDGDAVMICDVPDDVTAETVRKAAEDFDWDTCEAPIMAFIDPVVGGATLVTMPAFAEAQVVAAAVEAIEQLTIQAAIVESPPAEWFEPPALDGPTPLTVTADGQVYGHLALWDTCHRGFDGVCITPPRDSTNYEEFHANARVLLADGKLLGVGCLTMDLPHAGIRVPEEAALRHYDHSGTVAAYVRAGDDAYGVWVAGQIAPGLPPDRTETLRRLSLSGDWRPRGGRYHLIAAQAVPVPGFAIRARVASAVTVALTTVGPNQPAVPPSELALVASALIQLSSEVAAMRRQQAMAELTEVFT